MYSYDVHRTGRTRRVWLALAWAADEYIVLLSYYTWCAHTCVRVYRSLDRRQITRTYIMHSIIYVCACDMTGARSLTFATSQERTCGPIDSASLLSHTHVKTCVCVRKRSARAARTTHTHAAYLYWIYIVPNYLSSGHTHVHTPVDYIHSTRYIVHHSTCTSYIVHRTCTCTCVRPKLP